jgi:hypothetical protein
MAFRMTDPMGQGGLPVRTPVFINGARSDPVRNRSASR